MLRDDSAPRWPTRTEATVADDVKPCYRPHHTIKPHHHTAMGGPDYCYAVDCGLCARKYARFTRVVPRGKASTIPKVK